MAVRSLLDRSPSGFVLLLLAAAGIGVHVWFAASRFLPVAPAGRPLEYVFLGAPLLLLVGSVLASGLAMVVVHRLWGPGRRPGPYVRDVTTPDSERRFVTRWSWRAMDYLLPLALLGVAPLGAVALRRGADPALSALLYVLIDLRPWWTLALVGCAVMRFDRWRGARWRQRLAAIAARLSPARGLFCLDAALFLLLILVAVVSSPHLRFTSVLHGDEPKYMRLAENFYQGRGLDVSGQQTLTELTVNYSPPIARNASLFIAALRDEIRNLLADARIFLSQGFSFDYNRARFVEGWFIVGKDGGFYQVHNPALSVVLFPAYALDRHFLGTSAGYQDIFPNDLSFTNLALLLVWATYGVVVFRMVRPFAAGDGLAWLLAAATMLTMPVAAFAFQIYPETLGGVIVCAITWWLIGGDPSASRARLGLLAGVAAGFLPWLHVRFLVTSLVLAGWAMVMVRRHRLVFGAGYAAMVAALCLYAYHLTGSLRPDAMYAAEGSASPWRLHDALQSLASYPLDRIWGFLPHAPLYLFAIPGWLILLRRAPRAAVLPALLVGSLVLAAAGHGFTAAGATPLRHLVAVVPLSMIAVASTLREWGYRPWVRIAFAILLIVSLDASLGYNQHHFKEVGRMVDWSASGWAPNLLFPWTHGVPWEEWRGTYALFLAWTVLGLVLLVLPFWWRRPGAVTVAPRVTLVGMLGGTVMFVLLATGATALGGESTRLDYFIPAGEARRLLLDYGLAMDRCRACYSSLRGELGRGNLLVEEDRRFSFSPLADDIKVGDDAVVRAASSVRDGDGTGSMAVDFGDGKTARVDLVGETVIRHTFTTPGPRRIVAIFSSHGAPPERHIVDVSVRPAVVGVREMEDVTGLPQGAAALPVAATISRVTLGPAGLSVIDGAGVAAKNLILMQWDGARWRVASLSGVAAPPAPGWWVAIAAIAADGASRSEAVIVRWPYAGVSAGAAVVLHPF